MPIETVDTIEVFFRSTEGLVTLLTLGIILEFLFALALFRWKPLAFINAWIALVLAMLLAISSDHRDIALVLAILIAFNVLDIPLVAVVRSRFRRQEIVQRKNSQLA